LPPAKEVFDALAETWSMYEIVALLAGFTLLYSSLAGGIERSRLSGPIVFTLFGLVVGTGGLNLLDVDVQREFVKVLSELTLALVLFTDASVADLGVLRRARALPARLLLLGLPLTIALGYGVGLLLFDELSIFEIAVLATILAPTDAALGQAVVSNEDVPAPIRQGLSVESGLNDGICVPILFLFLALAVGDVGHGGGGRLALILVAEEIGIGALAGLLLTGLALVLFRISRNRDWVSDVWIQAQVVALALLCFASAQAAGGSGFIACFVGGLLLRARPVDDREQLVRAAEGMAGTLALLTWVVFGAVVISRYATPIRWEIMAYAILSLTIIRMLPVFVCLIGMPFRTEEKLFIGWFGPRGLASIVFGIIMLNADLPHGQTLAQVVLWTVIFSIVGHGVSANVWAKALGARSR
jgi:NhaP-type Na+/H+ or K+/H+ antiporter